MKRDASFVKREAPREKRGSLKLSESLKPDTRTRNLKLGTRGRKCPSIMLRAMSLSNG